MKKVFLLLFAFCSISVASFSQGTVKPVIFTTSGDTLTDADTTYHTLTNVGYYDYARVTYGVNKINGTVAGTAQLQGCSDASGTRWFNIDTVLTFSNVAVNQQTTLIDPLSWRHLRVRYITSGTVSASAHTDGLLYRNSNVKKE